MTTSDPNGTPEGVRPDGVGPDEVAGAGSDAAGTPAAPGTGRAGHHTYYEGGPGASAEPGGDDEYDHAAGPEVRASEGDALAEEDTMAATLLADLQRLQAEYVNYKKRVDRDREVIRTTAVGGVVESLLPVLDDIHMARQAGDLADGPFASIADKLESILGKFGVERVGAAGEEFDPTVHEALMHVQAELPQGATGTTVVQVLQPGYRIGERLVRAARVSVADPD
ncbi:GrpE protein HSP-70 cofactor [Intrasporangium oryzae NRRL B-24470]|uniref:Protein GrpE n=1 Tax=Intrasporangium oryzae NRRL B-24470 TaxID=1386089 RepID=W9G516_9MICO|nr:nucleotide exchange factor GrpE [Intrasporangium oryzae]EWT01241.1 GrpE protein HSP-70 cofactor [Intrasporangium oryzae NRRL B-24470]